MNTLLIFDDSLRPDSLDNILKNQKMRISLFPLTGNALVIAANKKRLTSLSNVQLDMIDSANTIHAEVTIMQKKIHEWSCQLGNAQVGKKKLKEWFLLPDQQVSAWWFGLLSEKNTTHDHAFFKLAQINAIKKHLQHHHYDACFIALKDKRQRKILIKMLRNTHLSARLITTTYLQKLKQASIDKVDVSALSALMRAGFTLIKWVAYSLFIKCNFPSLKKRLRQSHPFLFVSYFPNVLAQEAKQGLFRNKYALALQDKLTELNIPITWILMPVNYNDYNLRTAIHLAKRFLDQGENIFVIYEFFNLKIAIKSFFWWLRQWIISFFLYLVLDKKIFTAKLTETECLPIINYLWWHSTIGTSGIRGILYYLTYKELFKRLPASSHCLYYCEMQGWEKALNAAKKSEKLPTKTLAFQHTIVMRNLFNYFYASDEMLQTQQPTDLPLPDLLIANGKHMHALLTTCSYPAICEAEAIRQLYLNDILKKTVLKNTNLPILLVIGSFDKNETKSLISMVYAAFPKADQFEICCKGYPYTPLEDLFVELNINVEETGYKILHGDIAPLLEAASIAFVPSSAAAMEAIAYDCAVIVPVFADVMQLNPLVEVQANYNLVSSVEEFKKIVLSEMSSGIKDSTLQSKELIQQYWNLDTSLPLWEHILTQRLSANYHKG